MKMLRLSEGNFVGISLICQDFFRAKDFKDFDGFSQNRKNFCQGCTKFFGNQ